MPPSKDILERERRHWEGVSATILKPPDWNVDRADQSRKYCRERDFRDPVQHSGNSVTRSGRSILIGGARTVHYEATAPLPLRQGTHGFAAIASQKHRPTVQHRGPGATFTIQTRKDVLELDAFAHAIGVLFRALLSTLILIPAATWTTTLRPSQRRRTRSTNLLALRAPTTSRDPSTPH